MTDVEILGFSEADYKIDMERRREVFVNTLNDKQSCCESFFVAAKYYLSVFGKLNMICAVMAC